MAEEGWVVAIDSTVVRAHQHAAGARHEPPRDVPAEVLAVALADDLTEAVAAESGTVSAPAADTGGWVESHEFATRAGQTA
jgi:hypothetical protein